MCLFPFQIKMCETCQNAEHNKNVSRKARPVKVESPWEVLGLDIHGECLQLTGFSRLPRQPSGSMADLLPLPASV